MAAGPRLGTLSKAQFTSAPTLTSGDEYPLLLDSSGRLVVNVGATVGGTGASGVPFTGDTITRIAPTASNGGTAVTLVAAVALQRIYVATLFIYNTSVTVKHKLQLLSSGGTVLFEIEISAASSTGGSLFVLDGRGDIQTLTGEGLQFKFTDGGGAVGDLTASGAVVQKAP